MFGILKFQTFLLVVLLFICSCTYLHGVFPAWLDRNKTGYVNVDIRIRNYRVTCSMLTSDFADRSAHFGEQQG